MKYLRVEKENILANIELIRQKAGDSQLIAVLKANAYGLGLDTVYPILRQAGVRKLAVTEPDDALALRNMGAEEEEILVLRSTGIREEIEKILDACATATVGSYDAAVTLNGVAESRGQTVDVHIKVDTGMGRYGFDPSEIDKVEAIYNYMPRLKVTGMFTHFPLAFKSVKKTQAQHEEFIAFAEQVRQAGFNPGILHDSNSAALFACGLTPLDAVRIGSAVGGRLTAKGSFGLRKTGVLVSQVAEIRWLPKGHGVGYGSAYVTKHPTKIGVIPVGTADGFMVEKARDTFRVRDCFRCALSDLSHLFRKRRRTIIVDGRQATVLGHVGTTHTVVDLTEIDASVGDTAVLDVSPIFVPPSVERRVE